MSTMKIPDDYQVSRKQRYKNGYFVIGKDDFLKKIIFNYNMSLGRSNFSSGYSRCDRKPSKSGKKAYEETRKTTFVSSI